MQLKKLASSLALIGFAVAGSAHADKVKVEYWTMSLAPKFNAYFDMVEKKFEAQNPDIDVVWVDLPWDVIQAKLTAAIAAGQPPALVNLNVPWAYDYAQDGVIQPIDGLLGGDKSVYASGALADVTFKGKVYGFPWYNGANILAYNTSLFQKAGLAGKTPKSLDEELAMAKQIAAKTGVPGFAPALGKIIGIFQAEGLDIVVGGKAAFNSPAHVALLKKFQDAYKSGALAKDNLFAEDNFQTSIALYNAGKLGMLESTPSTLDRTKSDAKDIYALTEVAPAPMGPTKVVKGGWLMHFAVPKGVNAKILPATAKFAKFLTGDDMQLAFSKATGGTYPSTIKAGDDDFFQSLPAGSGALEKARAVGGKNIDNIRTLWGVPGLPDFEALNKRLQDAVEAGVTGKKDIKEALDDAATFWNEKLAKK